MKVSTFRYLCVLILILLGPFGIRAEPEANQLKSTTLLAQASKEIESKPITSPVQDAVQANSEAANPYGLGALWDQGDIVARVTLFVLLIMSIGSWYVIVTKLIEQSRVQRFQMEANEAFWNSPSIDQGITVLHQDSPYRFLVERGLESLDRHDGIRANIDLNSWVLMRVSQASGVISSRLQGGLSFLATVGSTAPFVGLFGTVWGIYHALVKIGISGQASIDKVAGPVGEALIMTAIGLAVAVPAVLGYNWLVRKNKAVMEGVTYFASELHAALLGSAKR
jgi:biopolymer transport protein ExbB